jgi:hypothetical protein
MKIKFTINKKGIIISSIVLFIFISLIVYVSSLNNNKGIHKVSELTMDYSGNELAFEQNSNNLIIVDNASQSMESYQSLYATGVAGKQVFWKYSEDSDAFHVYRGLCFNFYSGGIKCIYFKDYPY